MKIIREKVKYILGKNMYSISKPHPRKKVYKITLKNNENIRFEFKGSRVNSEEYKEISRLQMLAYNNDVNVPKVLFTGNEIKISQWIDGVEINKVRNEKEPNIQLGRLIGKLNTIKDKDKYLVISDLNNKNSIWNGKDLYLIDFCTLTSMSYEEAIKHTFKAVGIRIGSFRWNWFIKGYLEYHPNININNLINIAKEKRQYIIEKRKKRYEKKLHIKKDR